MAPLAQLLVLMDMEKSGTGELAVLLHLAAEMVLAKEYKTDYT